MKRAWSAILWAVSLAGSGCAGEKYPETPQGRFSGMGVLGPNSQSFYMTGGGVTVTSYLADAWRYDLEEERWEGMTGPPEALLRSAAVRTGDQVHLFGGTLDGGTETDTVYQWNLSTGVWSTRLRSGTWPEARYKHAAALVDGDMVVVGGKTNDGEEDVIFGDVWIWDIEESTWTELLVAGGPGGLYRHGLAWDEARGLLWVHGGVDQDEERQDWLWTLDLDNRIWNRRSWEGEGPPVRASHTFVATDRGLLVWGGNASDTASWLFDVENSTWTERDMEPAPLARDAQVADLHQNGDTLYLIGGDPVSEDVPDFVADVWSMDVASGEWREIAANGE